MFDWFDHITTRYDGQYRHWKQYCSVELYCGELGSLAKYVVYECGTMGAVVSWNK